MIFVYEILKIGYIKFNLPLNNNDFINNFLDTIISFYNLSPGDNSKENTLIG